MRSNYFFAAALQPEQWPFGLISVSPGKILQPPSAFGSLPGTQCVQPEHFCSTPPTVSGLSLYFSAPRSASFLAAYALRVIATTGMLAKPSEMDLRAVRRDGFLISFMRLTK